MASSTNQSSGPQHQQQPPHIAVGSTAIPIGVNTAAPGGGGVPQSVFVYVQGGKTSDSEHYSNNYPVRLIRGLAITQIVIAVLSVVSQVILIAIERYGSSSIGVGIWSGVFYGVAGAIGLYSAYRTTGCTVVSFMVTCIVASIFGLTFTVISSVGLGISSHGYSYRGDNNNSAAAGFYGFQVLLALTEMVVSIAASAVCCRASCCRSNSKAGQVYFQGNGHQQHHPTLPQQHIELGGFPAMSEAASVAVDSKGDLDRQESLPPQYDDMLPVTNTANDANKSDTEELVPETGEKYQRFQ